MDSSQPTVTHRPPPRHSACAAGRGRSSAVTRNSGAEFWHRGLGKVVAGSCLASLPCLRSILQWALWSCASSLSPLAPSPCSPRVLWLPCVNKCSCLLLLGDAGLDGGHFSRGCEPEPPCTHRHPSAPSTAPFLPTQHLLGTHCCLAPRGPFGARSHSFSAVMRRFAVYFLIPCPLVAAGRVGGGSACMAAPGGRRAALPREREPEKIRAGYRKKLM